MICGSFIGELLVRNTSNRKTNTPLKVKFKTNHLIHPYNKMNPATYEKVVSPPAKRLFESERKTWSGNVIWRLAQRNGGQYAASAK
jgi:hypothetical protein